MKAMAFDAYGTLFDVFSVTALGEELFPEKGDALAQLWRLSTAGLRSLMGRHRDFWRLTEDALVYAARSLGLDLTPDRRARLLEAYLTLAAFPDVRPGLAALKARRLRLAIPVNSRLICATFSLPACAMGWGTVSVTANPDHGGKEGAYSHGTEHDQVPEAAGAVQYPHRRARRM